MHPFILVHGGYLGKKTHLDLKMGGGQSRRCLPCRPHIVLLCSRCIKCLEITAKKSYCEGEEDTPTVLITVARPKLDKDVV